MGTGADAADDRIAAATSPEPLLFNPAKDPNETSNVIAQNPKKAKQPAEHLKTIKEAPAKRK